MLSNVRLSPAPGRLLRVSGATLALTLAMLLPACSPERDEAERNATAPAPAPEASPPAGAIAPPTAADARVAEQIAAKRRTLIGEAVEALEETRTALELLAAGKADQAREALTRATGKLEVVLAAQPDLALAPVEIRSLVHDVTIDPAAAEAILRTAKDALEQRRLQDARRMLAGLASEQVISVTNIPLATYPVALKQAAALIHAGRTAEAIAALEAAMSTLVIEETIIPLPLLRAETLLDEARPLAEKPQRSAAENDQLRRLLAAARRQVELTRVLGYATKDDIDALTEELTTIDRKTEGQGTGSGLFDRIKAVFARIDHEAPEAKK